MPPLDTAVAPRNGSTRPGTKVRNRIRTVTSVIVVLFLASVAFFLTWGVDGHWDFALPRRIEQLAALLVVGIAVAVSTVIFHTLTENHILTPSIMGFDALYILLATSIVFFVGAYAYAEIPDLLLFSINTGMLVLGATLLYRWILSDATRGLYTLVLVGVIGGTLFGSVTSFMFRVMNPNEFDVLMTVLFASFSSIDTAVLGIASVLLVGGTIAAYRMISVLDVLTLGRDRAITLGVDYRRVVTVLLVIVAGLVAVSTALVGPITFLGLLAANLAYRLTSTHRHTVNFPVAALLAVTMLILGQAALQHILGYAGTLGSIINLAGGIFFVILLVRQSKP